MKKTFKDFGVEFSQAKLNNGVPLFFAHRKGMPVYIQAVFIAGSRFDEVPGTAHFLEHMLVAGTERFHSKNLIAEHIQRVGGEFGASTNMDTLSMWLEIPEADDFDIGIDILSECLTKPLFDEKTIEAERGSILSELKDKKANPSKFIADVSRRIAFQNTSLENSNLGSEETIKSINKPRLLEYYKNFIHSGRLSFFVSGDIELNLLIEKLNSIKIQEGDFFRPSGRLPIVNDQKAMIEPYVGNTQLQVTLTSRTSIETYEEFCALLVLNQVLSVGRSSRLMTKLRYENGLVYTINGLVMNAPDWGRYDISFSCNSGDYLKVRDMIFAEFDNLRLNNVSEKELVDTKARVLKGLVRGMQTSASWVSAHVGNGLNYPEEIKTIEDYISTIEKLKLEDIKRIIDKCLNEKSFFSAICGDYK